MPLVTIIQGMLANDAVTTESISARQITADKIDQYTISTENIAFGAITSETLASKISITDVNSINTSTSGLSVVAPGDIAMYVGSANPSVYLAKVGVNVKTPENELSVVGTVSASGNITSKLLEERMVSTSLIFG